ncbi:hypothetical protein PRUPE_5G099300 [Prunus persica]|uniref:Uncharacterized protein n=1 Tax=Prunus persica TaxID=3760 RepID=A0A251P675_PRUPE|nr:hypothetical protein PRUPE_5G099300 [Prunus persica]
MTVCTTLGAVALPPIGRDLRPCGCCQTVNQHHAGSYMQSAFPAVVKIVIPFAPLFAVLAASLLACSSMVAVTLPADLSLMAHARTVLSGEVGVVILSLLLVHIAGFFVGYISAAVCGFREAQRRAISIEVLIK